MEKETTSQERLGLSPPSLTSISFAKGSTHPVWLSLGLVYITRTPTSSLPTPPKQRVGLILFNGSFKILTKITSMLLSRYPSITRLFKISINGILVGSKLEESDLLTSPSLSPNRAYSNYSSNPSLLFNSLFSSTSLLLLVIAIEEHDPLALNSWILEYMFIGELKRLWLSSSPKVGPKGSVSTNFQVWDDFFY